MRTLLLFPLLLIFALPVQNPAGADQDSAVTILAFKSSRSKLTTEQVDFSSSAPAPAMIQDNKNFEKNARGNAPAGLRDPNLDTADGRGAALEKSIQESRSPKSKPTDGFAYRVKVQNAGQRVIEILFWEYQFKEPANPTAMVRRQFLCGVNIKPAKEKELLAYSLSGPSDVLSAGGASNTPASPYQESVVINRVEYSDGTIWQRKDWNFGEVRATYKRALATPWGSEMCRGL